MEAKCQQLHSHLYMLCLPTRPPPKLCESALHATAVRLFELEVYISSRKMLAKQGGRGIFLHHQIRHRVVQEDPQLYLGQLEHPY